MLPYDLLRAEVFFPAREENQATNTVCTNMAVELAQTILEELRDPKKATSDYLSSGKGKFGLGETTHKQHVTCIGLMATNDPAESPFAGLSHQFGMHGRILGIHASAISQARINGDFSRILNEMNKKDGMFHCLSPKMKESLLRMAIRDAPMVRKNEEIALNKQREQKQNKQDILRKNKLLGAQDKYADALTYIEMFHSPAGWQRKESAVSEFEKITSTSGQVAAVKDQIRIRVLGFGWDDLHCAWSKDGVDKSPEQLLHYLTDTIIPQQTIRGIPTKPKIDLPSRGENIAILGTMARDIVQLDNNDGTEQSVFILAATAKRDQTERDGITDRHQKKQPTTPPTIDVDFVGTRIEQIWEFVEVDGTSKLIWCKGTVIAVKNNNKKVRIQWDAEYHRPGDPVISEETLLISKWNKQKKKAWRLVLD